MSTKIFVMTHKVFPVPKDPVYVPIQVGKAGKQDLGYLGDDTGENISEKNCYYSELTGLYWAAHNITDADYMGLCHYRRFFLSAVGNLMSGQEYEDILHSYDIILPRAVYYDKSYYEVYKEAHHINDLIATGEALRQLYPEDYSIFEEVVHGNEVYCGNLFVTSRTLFCEYSKWLFDILSLVEQKICVDSYDAYHKRVFGFLSEQLLYVWVKSRSLKIFECSVGLTQEKAETIELKERLRKKVAVGTLESIREALEIFRSSMKERPDLILQASDLSGELENMFRILYVCEKELEEGNGGMLDIVKDLDMLMKHYALIERILLNLVSEKASAEEIRYLKDAKVSGWLLQVLINNNGRLKQEEEKILSLLTQR